MATITQYFPAFFSGFTQAVVTFSNLEELVNIPFVRKFAIRDDNNKFSGFAIWDERLMAIYNDGEDWYVVGNIEGLKSSILPEWEENESPGNKDLILDLIKDKEELLA